MRDNTIEIDNLMMTNDLAYKLGRIALEVGKLNNDKVGDDIDRGLILLRRLKEEGFILCIRVES